MLENPTSAGLDQLKSWQRVLRVVEEQPKASSADEDFYFPKAEYAEFYRLPGDRGLTYVVSAMLSER